MTRLKAPRNLAARCRALGATMGIFGLVLILPDSHVAWWGVNARLSDEQKAYISDFERPGHHWAIARSVANPCSELAKLGVETREVLS
jgi:hypothetical protein